MQFYTKCAALKRYAQFERKNCNSKICLVIIANNSKNFLEESHGTKYESFFILYVITITWIMCVQERVELSSMSKRSKLSSTKFQEVSPMLQR